MASGLQDPKIALLKAQSRSERPSMRRTKTRHAFQAKASERSLERQRSHDQGYGVELHTMFLGISMSEQSDGSVDVGLASHDGTYTIDFAVYTVGGRNSGSVTPSDAGSRTPSRASSSHEERADVLADTTASKVREYMHEHMYKFVGAGVDPKSFEFAPQLPSRLWSELDIVAMVFDLRQELRHNSERNPDGLTVDEKADSMARKALMFFGPNQQPRVQVGFQNQVEVDCDGHAVISSVEQYKSTVRDQTWDAVLKYVASLKQRNIKIAFFNSTPQGGGVALMRHALIRYLRLVDVSISWHVPKPKPEIFRITKTNHNILQGVADPKERLTADQVESLDEWAQTNAERYWLRKDGPLAPRSEGGADVIIVDDPQLPKLVQIAKQADPGRPVIFRSHIQVRADLADKFGTPTSEVWQWIWGHVQAADIFISHPVREFVPASVDFSKVGYMPATTDWLDGLNKQMETWDLQYYIHEFNKECHHQRMNPLDYPNRSYLVQIARFDPAKGIPDVLASYAKLRREHLKHKPLKDCPQLVIAGHGAIDDPDASLILDQTLNSLDTDYADIKHDVVVLRLGPTDQILNALMSCAHVALQLSTREGFEVKVSEALHKGTPIIATKAGGIPLQVEHGKSGFLVGPGDSDAVAGYLYQLFEDHQLYDTMSEYAATHVSDEVSTVGNALAWLYLADRLSQGEVITPNSRWINDMAREQAGAPYVEGEVRLPRMAQLDLMA